MKNFSLFKLGLKGRDYDISFGKFRLLFAVTDFTWKKMEHIRRHNSSPLHFCSGLLTLTEKWLKIAPTFTSVFPLRLNEN